MAWYDGAEPVIRKSPGRADGEPEYDKLAWQPLGDLGLLHLRWATPGLAGQGPQLAPVPVRTVRAGP